MKMALWIARASHLLQWEDVMSKMLLLEFNWQLLLSVTNCRTEPRCQSSHTKLLETHFSHMICMPLLVIVLVWSGHESIVLCPARMYLPARKKKNKKKKILLVRGWGLGMRLMSQRLSIWNGKYNMKFPIWNMCSTSQNPAGLPTQG